MDMGDRDGQCLRTSTGWRYRRRTSFSYLARKFHTKLRHPAETETETKQSEVRKEPRGSEPALPSAPRARMEKTRPSRTTRSRWVGQVTSKSSMGVRVVTHVTPWVGSTELDKNNDIKRRSRKRVPLSSWESFPACAYKKGRGMGGVGTRTVEGKGTRPKEREIKSAAPGLPAWSPTAVLPRLEPA